jgi:hypothetical protein
MSYSVAYPASYGFHHVSTHTAPLGRYGGNSTDNFDRFHRLLMQWRFDTYFSPLMKEAIDDPSFQAIVKMGEEIVPWVIEEIRHNPDFLVLALHFVIPKENPVPVASRGKISEMVDAWLTWYDRAYRK